MQQANGDFAWAVAGIRQALVYLNGGKQLTGDLAETPQRVVRAYREMLSGMNECPDQHVKLFETNTDEMVICRKIEFVSVCKHHLLPFTGFAHVGYLPGKKGWTIGLSKMPRIVDCFARRLQTQEELTSQIAEYLMEALTTNSDVQFLGVGIVIEAKHSCLSCRGARKAEAEMITSSMLGYFRDKPEVRAEFLTLIRS